MREDQGASQSNVQKARNSQRGLTPRGPETEESKQDNPYYPAFDLLLAKLLAHEEVLRIVPRMISSDGECVVEPTASATDGDVTADSLQGFVADICEMRRGGLVRSFPTLRFPKTAKEARSHVNQVFRRRCYGWIVAQAFESFREFVEEIDRQLPAREVPRRHYNPTGLLGRMLKGRARRRMRHNIKDSLKRIREAVPELGNCETHNSRGVNLCSWFVVLTAVRNAVAHADSIIEPSKLRKLDAALLTAHFPGESDAEAGYVLNLTPDVARDTITRLREYSLAVYKAVSAAAKCPVTLYDPDEGMTIWGR